jgi:uncharacterized protein (TIGR03000 family)
MNRTSLKCALICAAALLAFWAVSPKATANWVDWYQPVGCCGYRSCYTPCCSSFYTQTCNYQPCSTPCYSSCYRGGWYVGWRPQPIRNLLFGPYRWHWSAFGVSCPTYASCSPVYDSCCDGSVAAPTQSPTPAKKPAPEPGNSPAPPAPAMPGPSDSPATKTSERSAENSGLLTVWVPYDAKVTVNGIETKSTGSRRQFVSYGLKPGLSYKYVVKAEVVRNGQVQDDTREIVLTAGQNAAVAFGFNVTGQQIAAAN